MEYCMILPREKPSVIIGTEPEALSRITVLVLIRENGFDWTLWQALPDLGDGILYLTVFELANGSWRVAWDAEATTENKEIPIVACH